VNYDAFFICGICFFARLLDKERKNTGVISDVVYLESVHADKSLWCRLTAAIHQVFAYILLAVGGSS
jgi:hypothetical protein